DERGPGLGRADRRRRAEEPVQERRLADVRAADQGKPRAVRLRALGRGLRQRGPERVEELRHTPPVRRGDGEERLDAERLEVVEERIAAWRVELVHGVDEGFPGAA